MCPEIESHEGPPSHSRFMPFHIGQAIRQELINQERSVAWFARKLQFSRTNIYKIFEKDTIDIKLLARISSILNRDFFRDLSRNSSDLLPPPANDLNQ